IQDFSARYESAFTAQQTEDIDFHFETEGAIHLSIDGKEVAKGVFLKNNMKLYTLKAEKGKTYNIQIDFVFFSNDRAALLNFDMGRPVPVNLQASIDKVKPADVIVFAGGISPSLEGEEMPVDAAGFRGGDRTEIELPAVQRRVVEALKTAGKRIVFVNFSGAAIALEPESLNCEAILQAWYPGQAGGQAVAEVLFGDYNPAGKLPLTFYRNLAQIPDFEDYNMTGRTYRYMKETPLFPFGHGLSYTKFEYSNLTVSENEITDDKTLTVMVDVTNTGDRDGMEVVQLYVSDKESSVRRPVRELKGFEKLSLKAGETKKAVFHLDKRSFAYYETDIHDWFVEYGEFGIEVGSSSRDIRLTTSVYVSSDTKLPVHFTLNTTCDEINSIPKGRAMFESIFGQIDCGFGDTASDDMGAAAKEMQESMLRDMPLRTMVTFTNIPDITRAKISEMVENLNQMLAEK
ncbi:glycoside hydrolase family 3 C-terminal domain-containing protein, partial [uncultured Ruminococcus sp.]|uniref:glycoside hydrolase family 3 C-terminal domain-containing protein n=1 Tax=uncultured Ruminococcus sp. TaxID=165186 RepID=UPI0025F54403